MEQVEHEEKTALDDDAPAVAPRKRVTLPEGVDEQQAPGDVEHVQARVDPEQPAEVLRLPLRDRAGSSAACNLLQQPPVRRSPPEDRDPGIDRAPNERLQPEPALECVAEQQQQRARRHA